MGTLKGAGIRSDQTARTVWAANNPDEAFKLLKAAEKAEAKELKARAREEAKARKARKQA